MKRKTIQAVLVLLSLAIVACSDTEQAEMTTDTPSNEYPLTTCVVSGEALGSMGEPVVYEHNGTTVKFCCKACIPTFQEDPEKYLSKIKS